LEMQVWPKPLVWDDVHDAWKEFEATLGQ
jgi:hypothetical protein